MNDIATNNSDSIKAAHESESHLINSIIYCCEIYWYCRIFRFIFKNKMQTRKRLSQRFQIKDHVRLESFGCIPF